MKSSRKLLLAALFVALGSQALPTMADSTTGTTVTIAGKPIPGKQVTATVVVTGKHLVDGPGYTVNGGNVQLTLNGTLVAQIRASYANSDVYDYGCVDAACGLFKYQSRNTTVSFPITLPKGATSYQFTGIYTGDADSHSSTSAAVNLKPVFDDVGPAIELLLD